MANQHNYPLIGQAFIGSKILSANFTLTGTDSGKGFTNASATGSITITLPKSAPGLIYQFLVVAAQSIVVQPQAVDTIRGSTIGTAVTLAGTPGTFLYLECLTTGFWEVITRQTGGGGGLPTGLANPTALVGLTPVNGTATTAMRSDAAPALDVGITPVWTGQHTWQSPGAISTLIIRGAENVNMIDIQAPQTSSGSRIRFFDTTASLARGFIGFGSTVMSGAAITDFVISAGPSGTVNINRANTGAAAFAVTSTGNVTIAAPSSAATASLVITGIASSDAVLRLNPGNSASVGLKILDPGANATQFRLNTDNTQVVLQALGTTTTMALQTSGGVALTLAAAGAGSFANTVQATNYIATAVASSGTATQIVYGSTISATATAGSATLPVLPVGFIIVGVQGTLRKIAYYAT
jgi:hypothetical protein